MRACASGHLKAATELLRAGSNVDARDHDERTALLEASQAGRLAEVALLLEAGASASLTDRFGHPPLFFAAFAGHLKVAHLLARRQGPLGSARTEQILGSLSPGEVQPPPGKSDLCVELVEASPPHLRWLWLDGWSSRLGDGEFEVVAALRRPGFDEPLLYPCARIKRTDVVARLKRTDLAPTPGFVRSLVWKTCQKGRMQYLSWQPALAVLSSLRRKTWSSSGLP